jgi:hypothetical protein
MTKPTKMVHLAIRKRRGKYEALIGWNPGEAPSEDELKAAIKTLIDVHHNKMAARIIKGAK